MGGNVNFMIKQNNTSPNWTEEQKFNCLKKTITKLKYYFMTQKLNTIQRNDFMEKKIIGFKDSGNEIYLCVQ